MIDDRERFWEQKPGEAAAELMVGLLTQADDGHTLNWSWARAGEPIFPAPLTTLPDDETSIVRLLVSPDGTRLGVRNEGVPGRLAVTLGLVWDHLLDCLESGADPAPWEAKLQATAAEARERAEHQRQVADDREARAWGGAKPTERLRELDRQTHARPLAVLDRALLDRLAALPAARQREVAMWAARRAVENAGLDRAGWVADILALIETGQPLPPWLTDDYGQAAFRRLFTDPDLPHTLITLPNGQPDFLQMSVAFPALTGLGHQDPLAAAIEAVYGAAISHGHEHARFLREAHVMVGETGDIDERG
ncbi:hypothetical protein FB565_007549 [Actinoplanes lutulentus]|nr:hypothetical protein [Actinoplanes lutulentus]